MNLTLRTSLNQKPRPGLGRRGRALDAGPHEVVADGDEPPAELGDRRRSTAFRFARERGAPAVRHGDVWRRQLRDPRRQEAPDGGDFFNAVMLPLCPDIVSVGCCSLMMTRDGPLSLTLAPCSTLAPCLQPRPASVSYATGGRHRNCLTLQH